MLKNRSAVPRKSNEIDSSSEVSHPFYVWSGLLNPLHRKRIGAAIWVFLWCLRRTTHEKGGLGFVLGGSRIKTDRIAQELGVTRRSVWTDLARLRQDGYLQVRRIPYGLIITVLKSKRGYEKKRSEENFCADRKESSDIKEKAVRLSREKRVSSGEASPYRKNSPPLKSSSNQHESFRVAEAIYV